MYALIVGGGHTGRHVAEALLAAEHRVAIVERNRILARQLAEETKAQVVEGDGADPKVLERAGVLRSDVVVAVTGDDEDNLVVCSLAKREYHVPRTVARINHPNNSWMYGKDMGVDVGISQAHIISQLILAEVTVGELTTLLRLQEGEVSLLEETVARTSRANGRTVGELRLPEGAVPVALLRGARVLVPTPTALVQAGDRLVVLARSDLEPQVAEALR